MHGVSLEALLDASALIIQLLGKPPPASRVARACWPSGDVNSEGMSWGRTSRRIPICWRLEPSYTVAARA